MSTWENISSGLLGGIIGGVLSFLVALFTIWRTRVGDREREAKRDAHIDEQRRVEIAAKLAHALRDFEAEIRWAPFLMGRYMSRLTEVTMLFAASQGSRHAHVVNWLMHQVGVQQIAMDSWRRSWWVPGTNKKRQSKAGTGFGEMAGVITSWAIGHIPDEAFSDPQRSAIEVARWGKPATHPGKDGSRVEP